MGGFGNVFDRLTLVGNRLIVTGGLSTMEVRVFLNLLYRAIEKSGYKDIIIDFSGVSNVFESFMIPVLAIIRLYQLDNVDFDIVNPSDRSLESLFHNANWAHYIAPHTHSESQYESYTHVPAIQFVDAASQHLAVDKIMNTIIGGLDTLNRGHLKALYWALTEITDNVLNHSESKIGGFVQASTFQKTI